MLTRTNDDAHHEKKRQAIVEPGGETGRFVRFSDAFAVRSADMTWRARFALWEHEDEDQPYKISFENLMLEESGAAMELKHHEAGFLWIQPGERSTQTATGGHRFEIRDGDRGDRFAVEVHALDPEEREDL